jgi:hypothetical protein
VAKREPSAWVYNWATLLLRGKYRDLVLQVRGWMMTLLYKKTIVVKCKEVKTRCSLAESSKEGYDSKMAALAIMMMVG